ncbi:FliM/FliN family flagellar motor switch protein [Limimaricola sp.]|uniref:FliM/FliN family flagellar motor switch protein n=1 Tax=Limimaricola sp. TaxID=2211665 RepID=UPI0040585EF5
MTMESVLRRLIGGHETPATGPASGGGAGLALARAAQDMIGLPLVVRGVARDRMSRNALGEMLDPEMLLIGLGADGAITGLAAVEAQLRCAVVEAQTLGAPRAQAVPAGPVTGTEAAMMAPLLSGLLERFGPIDDSELQAAVGLRPGLRLADKRAAGLILPEARYELLRFDVEIGPGSGRTGALMLALPGRADATCETPPAAAWEAALRDSVLQAPAELEAVLHRMRLPAHEIEALAEGDLLMLPGVDLTAIRLEDGRGRPVATVRLGQRAGLRAVRLAPPEAPPDLPLDIPPRLPG